MTVGEFFSKEEKTKSPQIPSVNLKERIEVAPKQREEDRDKIVFYLRIAFYACLILFLLSFLFELWSSYQISNALTRSQPSGKGAFSERISKANAKNLKKYFPLRIIGYHTKGIKDILGQEVPKAEAVYEPEDMNLQLRSPIVIYCQVVFFDDLEEAERFLQDKLREYPKNQQALILENTYANSGYASDDSAYFVGTIYKSMVFWFKTSYVELIPHEPDRLETLKYHNEKVASEVIKFIGQAEAGVEQVPQQ